MREYLILTRLQLLSLFSINKARHSQSEQERKKGRKNILMLLVMVVLLGNMSFTYSAMLATAIPGADAMRAMLMIIALATTLFLAMISLLSAKGVVFSFGDFDTLMSWPAPRMAVVCSRMTTLYAYNLFYAALLLLPAGIVYALRVRPNASFYPIFLLLSLFLPAAPTAVGALLGTGIAFLTARMKKRAIVGTAFQMLLFVGIMAASASINTRMPDIGRWAVGIRETVGRFYPPLVFFADACADGRLLPAAAFIAVSALSLMIAAAVVNKCFLSLSTRLLTSPVSDGRGARLSTGRSGALKALYQSEWKRYVSSSVYVLNTAIGTVILLLASAAMIIKRAEVNALFAEYNPWVAGLLLPFLLSFVVNMSTTTACSVSMEGKRLWIVKSLPVRPRDWLLSKALLSLTVTVPGIVVFAATAASLLPLTGLQTAYLFLLPLFYAAFMAVWGLAVNIRFPRLDWKNEAEAVKQSLSTLIAVFSSMLLTALPAVLALTLESALFIPLLMAALFTVSCLLFIRLERKGERTLLALDA